MGWNLLTRIHQFDHYGVSILRWYRFSARGKLAGIGRRLGLTNTGASIPVITDGHNESGEPDILSSLDYALYFLASCLFALEPLAIPATIFFPAETSYTSTREKRVSELFPQSTIEMIPGTHHTCISRHSDILAQKMKQTLDRLRQPDAASRQQLASQVR